MTKMLVLSIFFATFGKAVKELLKESGQIKDNFASDFQCFTLWCPRKRYVEKLNVKDVPSVSWEAMTCVSCGSLKVIYIQQHQCTGDQESASLIVRQCLIPSGG